MRIMYQAFDEPRIAESVAKDIDVLAAELAEGDNSGYFDDLNYFLVEDDGSALDLDAYHGWINPAGETWLGWIPGISMWKLRNNSDGSRILSLKRQNGQELSIGMDAAELRSLHKLLESDFLQRHI